MTHYTSGIPERVGVRPRPGCRLCPLSGREHLGGLLDLFVFEKSFDQALARIVNSPIFGSCALDRQKHP